MSRPRKRTSAKITPTEPITAPLQNQPEQVADTSTTPSPPVPPTSTSDAPIWRWEQSLGEFALNNRPLLLGLILVLAGGLRLFNLAARSVWYDESFSIILAGRDSATLLDATAHDYHPPLWYLLLSVWEQLFGPDLVAARFLSVVWGVATVTVIYLLAQKLFGSRTAMLAALFAAVSPFEILFSQEVRMYSCEACLGALLLFVFYRAYRYNSRLAWFWFAIVTALNLYTLYFAVFGVLALDIFFVGAVLWEIRNGESKGWPRTKLAYWVAANLVVAVLYFPWLLQMLGQVGRVQHSYWIQSPNPLEFLRLFDIYLFDTTNLTVPLWLATIGLLISAVVLVLLLNSMRFKLKKGELGRYRRSFELILCLVYWLGPVIIVFAVSYLFSPIYLERSLLAFAAPAYIVLARVIQVARRPRYWLFFLIPALLIVIASLGYYYFSRLYTQHYELQQTSAYIEARYQSGDVTVHSNKLSYLPFVYLKASGPQFVIPEQPDSPHNDLSLQTESGIGLVYTPIATAVQHYPQSRIWVVLTDPQPDTDPDWWAKTGQNWLDQHHYRLLSQTPDDMFWGEKVLLYAPQ